MTLDARSAQDVLQAEATRAAGDGVIEQVKRILAVNPARTLKSLVRAEVDNIAIGAITGWIAKRDEQAKRPAPTTEGMLA
jgi:hypothetical protein